MIEVMGGYTKIVNFEPIICDDNIEGVIYVRLVYSNKNVKETLTTELKKIGFIERQEKDGSITDVMYKVIDIGLDGVK
jgi:hypothetical protein